MTSSREDSHLQVNAHAGRTKEKARSDPGLFILEAEAEPYPRPASNPSILADIRRCAARRAGPAAAAQDGAKPLKTLERVKGIEPSSSAWKARNFPCKSISEWTFLGSCPS